MHCPPKKEAGTASLEISLSAGLAQVQAAARSVREFLLQHEISGQITNLCQLAMVEACNNAIQNSGQRPGRRAAVVRITCGPGVIEMRVTDFCPSFSLPKRVCLPPEHAETGRGLFLIHEVMDSVEYAKSPAGNELIMRKCL